MRKSSLWHSIDVLEICKNFSTKLTGQNLLDSSLVYSRLDVGQPLIFQEKFPNVLQLFLRVSTERLVIRQLERSQKIPKRKNWEISNCSNKSSQNWWLVFLEVLVKWDLWASLAVCYTILPYLHRSNMRMDDQSENEIHWCSHLIWCHRKLLLTCRCCVSLGRAWILYCPYCPSKKLYCI